jgi:fumarylacetoacetate (FAA) hydrolase family protein
MSAHLDGPLSVDAAIMRVLEAEQMARAQVVECAAQAELIRQAGRDTAHRIAERAAERTAAVHQIVDAAIRARIAELNGQRESLKQPAEPIAGEPERISLALDRLAAELGDGGG